MNLYLFALYVENVSLWIAKSHDERPKDVLERGAAQATWDRLEEEQRRMAWTIGRSVGRRNQTIGTSCCWKSLLLEEFGVDCNSLFCSRQTTIGWYSFCI